jgi:hypothetical protein
MGLGTPIRGVISADSVLFQPLETGGFILAEGDAPLASVLVYRMLAEPHRQLPEVCQSVGALDDGIACGARVYRPDGGFEPLSDAGVRSNTSYAYFERCGRPFLTGLLSSTGPPGERLGAACSDNGVLVDLTDSSMRVSDSDGGLTGEFRFERAVFARPQFNGGDLVLIRQFADRPAAREWCRGLPPQCVEFGEPGLPVALLGGDVWFSTTQPGARPVLRRAASPDEGAQLPPFTGLIAVGATATLELPRTLALRFESNNGGDLTVFLSSRSATGVQSNGSTNLAGATGDVFWRGEASSTSIWFAR